VVFIELKNEILRTKVLRMTAKDWLINIKGRTTLFVILSEAKNLLFFSFQKILKNEILRTYILRMVEKWKYRQFMNCHYKSIAISEATENFLLLWIFYPTYALTYAILFKNGLYLKRRSPTGLNPAGS
jgi:hypothetical protein